MLTRVVENWLVNTNERGYEVAFCQLLIEQGHKLLRLAKHGQSEQGKDIITINSAGIPCAYQLKSGNINMTIWRSEMPQITDLVEIPIMHPDVNPHRPREVFFVTNGEINTPVANDIAARNIDYVRRGHPALQTISGGVLLPALTEIHGRFFPTEVKDFRAFLNLINVQGEDMVDRAAVSRFLRSCLSLSSRTKKTEAKRNIASLTLLVSYLLGNAYKASNFVALIDGWTLNASHVLLMAERHGLKKASWQQSFSICMHAIEQALEDLGKEAQLLDSWVAHQGLGEIDITYRARVTLVLGYLCAFDLYLAAEGRSQSSFDSLALIEKHKNHLFLWGESAVPFFLAILWRVQKKQRRLAEGLLVSMIDAICSANARGLGDGMPNPYWSVHQCVRSMALGRAENSDESFNGHSYVLETLVEMAARRLLRQTLALRWAGISRVQYTTLVPQDSWNWFEHSTDAGELKIRWPKTPQSWPELLTLAREDRRNVLPQPLVEKPQFAFLYLLAYPHRVTPELVGMLDDVVVSLR